MYIPPEGRGLETPTEGELEGTVVVGTVDPLVVLVHDVGHTDIITHGGQETELELVAETEEEAKVEVLDVINVVRLSGHGFAVLAPLLALAVEQEAELRPEVETESLKDVNLGEEGHVEVIELVGVAIPRLAMARALTGIEGLDTGTDVFVELEVGEDTGGKVALVAVIGADAGPIEGCLGSETELEPAFLGRRRGGFFLSVKAPHEEECHEY